MRMAGGQRPGGRPSSGGIASCLSGCAYLAKQRRAHENRKNIPGCRDTACLGLAPDTKHCHEPDDGAAAARARGRGGVGSVGENGFITLIKVDRKGVGWVESVAVRVNLGGRRIITKKKNDKIN